MKVKQMKSILETNKFDNVECNFKLKSKGPQAPIWFSQFINEEFRPAINQINSRIDKLESRIDKLESRIDNLVSKNHLQE